MAHFYTHIAVTLLCWVLVIMAILIDLWDGTQTIAHEETLLRKRQESGLSTLPADGSDGLEWTFPVYDFGSVELQSLLASPEWYQEHNLTGN